MENGKKIKEDVERHYDYNNLSFAQLAGQYLAQGDEGGVALAGKTLDKILKKCEYEPYVRDILSNPKNVRDTIKGQLETYSQCKNEETIEDLLNYHASTFDSYSEGGSLRVKESLKDLLKMKYGDLEKEIAIAEYKIKGEKLGQTSKEDAEKAKKKLEEYQKVATTIALAESQGISDFRTEVEGDAYKEHFNEMYPAESKDEKDSK